MLFALDTELPLFAGLCEALGAEAGSIEQRQFPDGESYLRVASPVEGRDCVILANLVDPDSKFLPLAFLAGTLRELGARSVGLVAPYLCYMRQDTRFHPGEAVTSRLFASLLSEQVDWLVTVDPHLHRYHTLDEIYSIPSTVVQGAPALAQWFKTHEEPVVLVGPDSESEQWVSVIAERIGQPFVVGRKERRGDRDVVVTLPNMAAYRGRTAVIVDDVISSGHTVLKALASLQASGMAHVDCAAVHGIFADGVEQALSHQGLRRLITANSVPHISNVVDLSPWLVGPIQYHLGQHPLKVPGKQH
ncbi:ribose-phosphate diphosphokinase [Marinimicrobium locisalis]|uniref:ribose-phosphate diphosphokinase n=1 Tax=Marinimicrobium locisalis TaxID=546022 RepID=UPI003221D713